MKLPWATRDLALALGVVALGELELFSGERYNAKPVWPGPVGLAAILIVCFAAPLNFRRSHPEAAVVSVFGFLSIYGLTAGAPEAATGFVLLIVTAFSGAAYARHLWVVLAAAGVFCVVFFFDDASAKGIADKTWVFGLGAVAVLLGRAVHARQARIGRLESDATTTLARHAAELEVAVAAERGVIARELHDIVSHAVSVIVIQAQVGNRALPGRPEAATRALEAIEESARTAMVELRRLLTVLGPDTDAEAIRPTASLSQLDDLLNGWRTAGMDVELAADTLPVLPAAVDLAAYRIVQESLTNTARHAPGARSLVRLTMEAGHLEVTTQDSGRTTLATADTSVTGRGIIGMRQRALLVGGELVSAGPSQQGFLVHARLPVPNASA